MRWWPWRRRRKEPAAWSPPEPVPDGDTVPVPGWPQPARNEREHALDEPTQNLPLLPLLTRAGQWRANGGRWYR